MAQTIGGDARADTRRLLAALDALPELSAIKPQRGMSFQDIKIQYRRERKPFKVSDRDQRDSVCGHSDNSHRLSIYDMAVENPGGPGGYEAITVCGREIHEVREHDKPFSPSTARFLTMLARGAPLNESSTAPDLRDREVVEVLVWVDEPPYVRPEELAIRDHGDTESVVARYSGLEVQGQAGRRWVVREPGEKAVSRALFRGLAEAITHNAQWIVARPVGVDRPGSGGDISLTVVVRPAGGMPRDERVLTVRRWYFRDGRALDAFNAVVRAAGELYGVNMLDIAEYD